MKLAVVLILCAVSYLVTAQGSYGPKASGSGSYGGGTIGGSGSLGAVLGSLGGSVGLGGGGGSYGGGGALGGSSSVGGSLGGGGGTLGGGGSYGGGGALGGSSSLGGSLGGGRSDGGGGALDGSSSLGGTPVGGGTGLGGGALGGGSPGREPGLVITGGTRRPQGQFGLSGGGVPLDLAMLAALGGQVQGSSSYGGQGLSDGDISALLSKIASFGHARGQARGQARGEVSVGPAGGAQGPGAGSYGSSVEGGAGVGAGGGTGGGAFIGGPQLTSGPAPGRELVLAGGLGRNSRPQAPEFVAGSDVTSTGAAWHLEDSRGHDVSQTHDVAHDVPNTGSGSYGGGNVHFAPAAGGPDPLHVHPEVHLDVSRPTGGGPLPYGGHVGIGGGLAGTGGMAHGGLGGGYGAQVGATGGQRPAMYPGKGVGGGLDGGSFIIDLPRVYSNKPVAGLLGMFGIPASGSGGLEGGFGAAGQVGGAGSYRPHEEDRGGHHEAVGPGHGEEVHGLPHGHGADSGSSASSSAGNSAGSSASSSAGSSAGNSASSSAGNSASSSAGSSAGSSGPTVPGEGPLGSSAHGPQQTQAGHGDAEGGHENGAHWGGVHAEGAHGVEHAECGESCGAHGAGSQLVGGSEGAATGAGAEATVIAQSSSQSQSSSGTYGQGSGSYGRR